MSNLKPKITLSSVRGKVIITAEDGARVGQWGGTECFLSRQPTLGPCFIVRCSKHKKHEGTFFLLKGLQRVLSTYAMEGKLTIILPHERRLCTIFIETTVDINELRIMAAVLQDRNHWKEIERNVACRKGRQARGSQIKGGNNNNNLRDPNMFEMQEWEDNNNDNDDDEYEDDENNNNNNNNNNNEVKVPDMTKLGLSLIPPVDLQVSLSGGNILSNLETESTSATINKSNNNNNNSRMSWTVEQMRAMQMVRAGRNVFITGSAGTGKTAWLLHLVNNILSRNEGTVVTATTGIAARIIGGCTIHSFAGIGKGDGAIDKIYHRVQSRPNIVRGWKQCTTLIIDEIGVLPLSIFLVLDEIARRIRNKPDKPFGGIQLILLGDFLQLPPVISRYSINETKDNNNNNNNNREAPKWCFEAPLWEKLHLVYVEFRRNYRHETDPLFASCMEDIRFGKYTKRVEKMLSSCLSRRLNDQFGVEPTVIMSRRQDAATFNIKRLQQLESVYFHRYESEDYAILPGMDINNEVSFLSLLELRVGAQVVLLSTFNEAPYLSNGDLGVVVGFAPQSIGPALPIVCFINNNNNNSYNNNNYMSGEEVVVPRVRVEVMGPDGILIASRTQIPLQLAWALTVHRVQGMTLPMVQIQLDEHFFECGQAYVALTRARKAEDVMITRFDPKSIRADAKAVAFYQKYFPQKHLEKNNNNNNNGEDEDGSELVDLRRGGKRQRSPPINNNSIISNKENNSSNINNNKENTQWEDESFLNSQVDSFMPLVPPKMMSNALQLLADAGSAIPQLTQESDIAMDNSFNFIPSSSQRTLLMDDE